jgi:hypothetical protein
MRLLQQKGRTTNIFLLIDGSSNMQKHRRGHLGRQLEAWQPELVSIH